MKRSLFAALIVLAMFWNPGALAQTWRGTVSGIVTDSSGGAISNAAVSLTSRETGQERTAASGEQGFFAITLLPPGRYRLEVEHEGFRKNIRELTLEVNQDIRADTTLVPGQQADEVTVTASRETLKTDSVSLGTVINARQIRELPLDGRNFYELSLLAPGTIPAAPGSAGSVRGDFAININGAREDANNFILDGVYNGDPKLNGVGVTPSVDAIREFEVLTNTYDASFGRNAGGQVNVVLQSGSNQLHGTAYGFLRNASLDARNAFAPSMETDPR
ncbi:MAG: carboxypeptidase regulatory-like domain-containing protein, partial [Bryobacteraceae bacterium]